MSKNSNSFSHKSICHAIDSVAGDFLSCLETVLALEGRATVADFGQSIAGFQPKLFTAIARLDGKYRAIIQEEKRLVLRKEKLDSLWFKRRMGNLAKYRKALREGILVGKSIGDGFAWFFYERDRELITEHLKHDFHTLLPPGDGRIGERKCLDAFRYVDGHFQLYHGITTFLRLGDCSFVNLSTMRISAIGEVKTKRTGEDTLTSSLSLVFGKDQDLPNFNSIVSKATNISEKFDQKTEQRRKRQVKQMTEAVSGEKSIRPENTVDPGDMEFSFKAIDKAVTECKVRNFSAKQVSDGMMICVFRLKKKHKLSSALLSQSNKDLTAELGDFPKEVIQIMVPDRKDNSLRLGSLGFAKENLISRSDRLPFVLWPLSAEVIIDVMLGSVLIVVLFNPLPFKLELEDRGYQVEISEKFMPISARKIVNDRSIILENLSYFFDLILYAGMSEKDVLWLIDQSLEIAKDKAQGQDFRMEIVPQILK